MNCCIGSVLYKLRYRLLKCVQGALDLESKNVEQVMTPEKDVFMLNVDEVLNKETLKLILHRGEPA